VQESLPPSSTAPTPQVEDAETQLRNSITARVDELWEKSDFAGLDSLADTYVETKARTLSGKWKLPLFYDAISRRLEISWPKDGYLPEPNPSWSRTRPDPARFEVAEQEWENIYPKVRDWAKRYPRSAHARIATAKYFINRAWFFRGSASASMVRDEAWPRVNRYIEQARKSLVECENFCRSDPHWYEVMFFIASAQSWPHDQIDELVHEFTEHGQAYTPAYQSAARMLLPKWGGSYEAVEQLARIAVSRDGKLDGDGMYTRIYWNLGEADSIFTEGRADWKTMKHGFEEILTQYPDPRNLNGEAMFACAAGDRVTYRSTMKRLGKLAMPSIWLVDFSDCEARFGPV
jgi:hypothetical protein